MQCDDARNGSDLTKIKHGMRLTYLLNNGAVKRCRSRTEQTHFWPPCDFVLYDDIFDAPFRVCCLTY
jgi:hypothetical protein